MKWEEFCNIYNFTKRLREEKFTKKTQMENYFWVYWIVVANVSSLISFECSPKLPLHCWTWNAVCTQGVLSFMLLFYIKRINKNYLNSLRCKFKKTQVFSQFSVTKFMHISYSFKLDCLLLICLCYSIIQVIFVLCFLTE